MCGIFGLINLNGKDVDPETGRQMQSKLFHRGPDQQGQYCEKHVCMGNTRLQVTGGNDGVQPMYSDDHSVVLVFNGEIYNYKELRAELKESGAHFKTDTDTEVVLQLYLFESIEAVHKLNGMFSFAIYDKRNGSTFIVRDRFGVKPLYYYQNNETLAFASELKALKCIPDFDNRLSAKGISSFLGLMYIPEPCTLYQKVRKLEQGMILRITGGRVQFSRYHDFCYKAKLDISYQDALERSWELLNNSVQRQQNAEVKMGVLLSGGLDSRTVLAASALQDSNLDSYTITFEDSNFNEGDEAAFWASQLSTGKMHRLLFTDEVFANSLVQRMENLDEPYALWCNVASAAMAEFASAQGVKVLLGGDGGDEMFVGYPTVHAMELQKIYRKLPDIFRSRVIRPLVNRLPGGNSKLPLSFMMKSFVNADNANLFRAFFGFKEVIPYISWKHILTDSAFELVGQIDPFFVFQQYQEQTRGVSDIDAATYLDSKVFLSGCSFAGQDNAYMQHSVELRVPFLDNELSDFVCRLPVSVRFNLFRLKPLLQDIFREKLLPSHLPSRYRKYKKAGFDVPIKRWLKSPRLKEIIHAYMGEEANCRAGFFKPEFVRRVLNEQERGVQNNERIIQSIFALNLFILHGYR